MGSVSEIKNLDCLLEKHFQKKIKILEQQINILTAPGENYGSVMVSLNVKIEDENTKKQDLNLVAKLIPTNEMLRELFQVQVTFIKELRVYTKIVPTLAEIEREHGILEERASDFFAECFGGRSNLHEEEGTVNDDSVLLLENLKVSGFETGDRLVGFDLESAEFILKKLAKVHATTIALRNLKPDIYEDVVVNTLSVKMPSTGDKEKCVKFVEGIKEMISINEKYTTQAEKACEDLKYKLTVNFYHTGDPKDTFVTFSHSDFWVNNMMLKRDKDGKPIKLMIVDFQTPQNQSIVSDLLFFIYSSVSPSIVYDKVDELIKIYYDSFIGRLKEFNLDLEDYSWDAFMQEIKTMAVHVLSQILMMYKPILLERGKIDDMDNYKDDDFFNLDNITDYCKNCMIKSFTQFAEKGWV